MAVAMPGTADYRPPRWFLVAAACAVALLYAAAMTAINLFPFGGGWNPTPVRAFAGYAYEHGWPLVYMLRAMVNNARTLDYGPWPVYDSPLIEFRPALLFLNVLCGGLLALSATVIPVYWLRVRRRPLQFSLRALVGTITVVACLLGLAKWYNPDWVSLNTALGLLLIVLPRVLLYALPAGLILVAAHWAAGRTAGSPSRGRWRGIHWLTWLAIAAVGGPFLHYAILADTTPVYYSRMGTYGWPLRYGHQCLGFSAAYFNFFAFGADLAVWLLVVAATGFIVQRWVRRVQQRTAMRPSAILVALAVAGVVIWIVNLDDSLRPAWYDYPSWLLGIAAAVYAAGLLVPRPLNRVARICLLAGIGVGVAVRLGLPDFLGRGHLVTGLSLVAGAYVALAVDGVYRLLHHPEEGVWRFVRPDGGGRIAVAPAWAVATIAILGGLALIYLST